MIIDCDFSDLKANENFSWLAFLMYFLSIYIVNFIVDFFFTMIFAILLCYMKK